MAKLDLETLSAFVDGELNAARESEVAAAIACDPEAQQTVERLRHLTMLLRDVFDQPAYQDAPPGLAQSLAAPVKQSRRWFVAAIAATAVLTAGAFAGGFMLGQRGNPPNREYSERLLDEVADYHAVYARENEHQVEVPAERLAHIEAWFGAVLHRTLRIPDLSDRGLTFAGGRLLVVDGVPVTQLLYRWPGRPHEPFGLCISPDPSSERGLTTDAREGLQQVLWRRKGYTYVLVGWTSRAFLASVAAELMPKLDPVS